MALTNKFNFKLITALKGEGFTRDLKQALAIKASWGYEYLSNQHPALKAVYTEAKKLPTTQKEWGEKNTKWYTTDQVFGNNEVPAEVQDQFRAVVDYAEGQGLTSIKGIFLQADIRNNTPIWWLWDDGTNGRWFKRDGTLAKVAPIEKDNETGYYRSAVSTYYNRIQKGLPLYAA